MTALALALAFFAAGVFVGSWILLTRIFSIESQCRDLEEQCRKLARKLRDQ